MWVSTYTENLSFTKFSQSSSLSSCFVDKIIIKTKQKKQKKNPEKAKIKVAFFTAIALHV